MKEGTYISNLNYITKLLELKNGNIKFYENCYHKEKINGMYNKVFKGVLSYKPIYCSKCEVHFDEKFEKHFITSNIKLPNAVGFMCILKLKNKDTFINILVKLLL